MSSRFLRSGFLQAVSNLRGPRMLNVLNRELVKIVLPIWCESNDGQAV